MRKILLVLSLLLLLTGFSPTYSDSPSPAPYVAVFATDDIFSDVVKYKPDLYFKSSTFTNLDFFLSIAELKAGNRPIVVDIACHGNEVGYLATNTDGDEVASVGYLVNVLDKHFHDKPGTVVLLEACDSQICMEKTLRQKLCLHRRSLHIESFPGKGIPFPIYGIGPHNGIFCLMYDQYYYGIHLFYKDLRQFIDQPVDPVDESKDIDLTLKCLCAFFDQLPARKN